MIFRPQLARAVANGKKTQTRRPVKADKPCRYKVGGDYAVQPGRGKEAIARIKVLETREERVGQITHADAKAEGFRNAAAFKVYWLELYDSKWIDDNADGYDVPSDAACLLRFSERHAHRLVTVISFELVQDTPRFLAQPGPHQGDYTEQRHRAIDDLEVVPAQYQEKLSKDALGFCIGRQMKRAKEQREAKADRGRSMRLAPHERFRRAA